MASSTLAVAPARAEADPRARSTPPRSPRWSARMFAMAPEGKVEARLHAVAAGGAGRGERLGPQDEHRVTTPTADCGSPPRRRRPRSAPTDRRERRARASALKVTRRRRSAPTSSAPPTIPLHAIVTAANAVSRATRRVVAPEIMGVTISATSPTVTATASTSARTAATRWATTGSWWTADRTTPRAAARGPRRPRVAGSRPNATTSTTTAAAGTVVVYASAGRRITSAGTTRR
jgi:hypothetical protein